MTFQGQELNDSGPDSIVRLKGPTLVISYYHFVRYWHLDLEAITTDREVISVKSELARRFGVQVYNGLWFSPEGEFTRQAIANRNL